MIRVLLSNIVGTSKLKFFESVRIYIEIGFYFNILTFLRRKQPKVATVWIGQEKYVIRSFYFVRFWSRVSCLTKVGMV